MSKKLQNIYNSKPAIVWIYSTNNNTILTLTDINGNTKAWSSSGSCGFKNSRKSTAHSAEVAAADLYNKMYAFGFDNISIKMKGLGSGKQKALSALIRMGIKVLTVEELSTFSHNGCRLPRKRRI